MKAYLGVLGTAEDATLELLFDVAVELADLYLEADLTTLPRSVELGVYLHVKTMRDRGDGDGLTRAETKDLVEAYADAYASDAAFRTARAFWRPYKTRPWLDGR